MNSITDFIKNDIPKLEGIVEMFYQNPKQSAEFEDRLLTQVHKLVLAILSEAYTNINNTIKDSNSRKGQWNVVKTEQKKLMSSIGEFAYSNTTFVNKETYQNVSLVNEYLGITPHQRTTEGACVRMLNEAVHTSYERAGNRTSILDELSKEAVMKYLHTLKFPEEANWPIEKRVVKTLFIEADEDHCSLQFQEKKGDLVVNENNYKNNCILTKIVYVHEGIERAELKRKDGKSKRRKLVNPHYFSGVYEGEANQQLWNEVYRYLDHVYDLSKVEHIYLMSDGGAWIKTGRSMIGGLVPVLDEFHLKKYLLKMTRHMMDSAEDARREICEVIKNETKEKFKEETEKMLEYAKTDAEKKHIQEGSNYILSNWSSAKVRLANRKWVVGCSAEGHVSHVLADRMTSRPMGWSKTGADKMAHLRAFYYNQGNVLELVRYQKKELPVAAGAEEIVKSCGDILREESKKSLTKTEREIRKYHDVYQASISKQDRIRAYLGGKIILF